MSVESLLQACRAWCLACPCHRFEFKTKFERSRLMQRTFGVRLSNLYMGCPFKGCRAAEMASKRLLIFATQQARLVMAEMVSLIGGLTEEERSKFMDDWSRAVELLHYELSMKTSYWQRLPYSLFAIGLLEADEARELGREAVRIYDSEPDAEQHFLSVFMCSQRVLLAGNFAVSLRASASMISLCSLKKKLHS